MLPLESKKKPLELQRTRFCINKKLNTSVEINNQNFINFSSNDYLNISTHPEVKKAFIQGIDAYGLGSGSAHFVCGYHKAHQQLEEAFCEFLQRDQAILFNSGYHANLGTLTALTSRNATIVADKLCHASIIDGCMLTKAKLVRYHHNDKDHANYLVQRHKPAVFITESVFGMEGSITHLAPFLAIAKNSLVIVDDAHGFGILGETGGGICEAQNLTQQDVPCLVTPFGKALGSFGAIVSGSKALMDAILQQARSYCYSTALPPAVCYATLTALNIVRTESWRREQLQHLIAFFLKEAQARVIPLLSQDKTPIKAILVKNNAHAVSLQKKLMALGFLVACIRPPSVPSNTARLKITLNCLHTEAQITQLLDAIRAIL